MANSKNTSVISAVQAVDIKRALIGFMLDTKVETIDVSPASAGALMLAPEDYDVEVRQDRYGIHVTLIDQAKPVMDDWDAVQNGIPGKNEVDGVPGVYIPYSD